MMTVSTNFGTEADLKDAVVAAGRTVVEDEAAPVVPVVPETPEPPAKPGEGEPPPAAAAPEAKTTPVQEPGEKKPQEQTQAAPQEPAKPTHGFKSKAEKAQALVERLSQDLELERGSKSKLQEQLVAAQAELAALKPTVTAPATPTPGPVKPKRPTRKDLDFDDDKYEAAMAAYEGDMETYNQQRTAKAIADAMAEKESKDREAKLTTERNATYNTWVDRRNEGAKEFPDWQEVFEAVPDEFDFPTDVMKQFVFESESTAAIMYHFAKDVLDNAGKEIQRIGALGPLAQVRELTLLESRLTKKPIPAAEPPAAPAPAKPPETVPAKPKTPPVKVVEPIETVGAGRAAANGRLSLQDLAARADAGDQEARKEYFRRRAAHEG